MAPFTSICCDCLEDAANSNLLRARSSGWGPRKHVFALTRFFVVSVSTTIIAFCTSDMAGIELTSCFANHDVVGSDGSDSGSLSDGNGDVKRLRTVDMNNIDDDDLLEVLECVGL